MATPSSASPIESVASYLSKFIQNRQTQLAAALNGQQRARTPSAANAGTAPASPRPTSGPVHVTPPASPSPPPSAGTAQHQRSPASARSSSSRNSGVDLESSGNNAMIEKSEAWFCAQQRNDIREMKRLVDKGLVAVNVTDGFGCTALHYVAAEGNLPAAEMLIALGIHGSAADHQGRTAVHYAVQKGQLSMVQYLHAATGINLNHRDWYLWTPLHVAASIGDVDIVQYLLHSNVNTRLTDFENMSPVDLAVDKKHFDVAQLILDSDEREHQNLRDQLNCVVCMERPRCVATLDCRHFCLCTTCAPHLRRCPVCRAHVKSTLVLYTS